MIFGRFRKYRLLTPGPVPTPPKVLKALAKPMLHHRTPEFEKTLDSALKKLKLCFQTKQPVMIHAATGSGAMESALVNTLSPNDEVIAVVSGKFGERWAQMAAVYGIKPHVVEVPWGHAVRPEQVESALIRHPRAKGVLVQACETSTATEHPIHELSELKKKRPEILILVDAITAIGAMDLPMDQWNLDVVVSGSQKAFMLPTGISFISLSELAWKANERSTSPKYYWDLKNEKLANEKSQTYFSSAVSHIRALDVALNDLSGSALQRTIERTRFLARLTREASSHLGLGVYSKAPASAVTAISLPENIDGEKLRNHIEKKYKVTLMGGQDHLKGKILRMGHLGYITNDDLCAGIEAIGYGLMDLGYKNISKKSITEISKHIRAELESTGM